MSSTASAITERYRCPEVFLSALPQNGDHCPDILDISEGQNYRVAPFDPSEAVDDLRLERYASASETCPSISLRNLYYSVRPLLPVSVRRHIQKIYLRGWNKISFPRWPLDVTVERLLETSLLAIMQAAGIEEIPFIWFWPEGAESSAIVTHDVETTSGRDFCETLMDIDESFGIRSSFQLVPEERYTLAPAFLEMIRSRGHDINIQDLNHDGRLFSNRTKFEVRVKRINQYGHEFGAQGFRSAILYRKPAWFDQLDFQYDMSLPNVGHLDAQRGGCCTVFPYFIGRLLEIPVTATQDYSLFHILRDYRLDLWKTQAAGVAARNGLLSFIAHPDYLLDSRARNTYHGLLEFLSQCRSERGMWIATANQVNKWWRLRSRMTLIERHGLWHIEGPGCERARLAFARVIGGKLRYFR
jgi:hypothetical protein